MKTVTNDALAAAEQFLYLNARLIDRLRFAHHFRNGPARAVVDALRPYQNADGGFGNALEPDLRAPDSQPLPTETALHILDEAGALGDPMVADACDYLASITRPGGGVPFVLPSVRQAPHPWWLQTDDDPPAGLNPTAALAGLLHKAGADHPWVATATRFSWERIEVLEETNPYEAYSVLGFLDHVPDRERAGKAFERLRPRILDHVAHDPNEPGEVHFPLDYAPAPGCLARRMFDDELIEAHLDALVAAQQDDGGWTVNFQIWTPITGHEWRSFATVTRLLTLRAYDRIEPG